MALLSRALGMPRMMSGEYMPPALPSADGFIPNAGGGGGGMRPPVMPPIVPQPPQQGGMGGGAPGFGAAPNTSFMQAFSQNPQFQQQLQSLMSGQSPGFGPVQFNPLVRG